MNKLKHKRLVLESFTLSLCLTPSLERGILPVGTFSQYEIQLNTCMNMPADTCDTKLIYVIYSIYNYGVVILKFEFALGRHFLVISQNLTTQFEKLTSPYCNLNDISFKLSTYYEFPWPSGLGGKDFNISKKNTGCQ